MQDTYEKYLAFAIKYRRTFFLSCVLVSFFLIGMIGMIFICQVPITPIPKKDAGILCVNLSGPDTFVLDDTLEYVKQVEKIVENEESIENTFSF